MNDDTFERVDGPTPNGGDYYIAHFHDGAGSPMTRMEATHVTIQEFTAAGELLRTHHAYLGEPEM